MSCDKSFCRSLREFLNVDRSVWRSSRLNLLSTDGKVLAVIVASPDCIVKDIPSLARISPRAAFEALKKLEDIGVIERVSSPRDRRAIQLKVKHEIMCERICKNI